MSLNPGLINVTGTAAIQCGIWVSVTLRKSATCALTGKPLAKGSLAYRPLTNSNRRMERVSVAAMTNTAWFRRAQLASPKDMENDHLDEVWSDECAKISRTLQAKDKP